MVELSLSVAILPLSPLAIMKANLLPNDEFVTTKRVTRTFISVTNSSSILHFSQLRCCPRGRWGSRGRCRSGSPPTRGTGCSSTTAPAAAWQAGPWAAAAAATSAAPWAADRGRITERLAADTVRFGQYDDNNDSC